MEYSKEQRKIIIADCTGKTIESLKWDEVDEYWVITLTGGIEATFRFMAELNT